MALISVPFDENLIQEVAAKPEDALEVTLPEPLDEAVWQRLQVICELSYPYPVVVTFSPSWIGSNLEGILTRLATSAVSGVVLKNTLYTHFLSQVNRAYCLGLSIIQ